MDIQVRRAEPNDAAAVKAIYEGVVAYSGTLQLPNPSLELWTKRLANIPDNVYSYVAEIDGEIVGNVGFMVETSPRRRHVATFGIGVKDEMQGKGIGSALIKTVLDLADNWLNLRRIELTVYSDNEAAVTLYKKMGFVIEGEGKDFAFRNGRYVDVYYMARIHQLQ